MRYMSRNKQTLRRELVLRLCYQTRGSDNGLLIKTMTTKTTQTTQTTQTTPKLLPKTHSPYNIHSLDIENLDGVTSGLLL